MKCIWIKQSQCPIRFIIYTPINDILKNKDSIIPLVNRKKNIVTIRKSNATFVIEAMKVLFDGEHLSQETISLFEKHIEYTWKEVLYS